MRMQACVYGHVCLWTASEAMGWGCRDGGEEVPHLLHFYSTTWNHALTFNTLRCLSPQVLVLRAGQVVAFGTWEQLRGLNLPELHTHGGDGTTGHDAHAALPAGAHPQQHPQQALQPMPSSGVRALGTFISIQAREKSATVMSASPTMTRIGAPAALQRFSQHTVLTRTGSGLRTSHSLELGHRTSAASQSAFARIAMRLSRRASRRASLGRGPSLPREPGQGPVPLAHTGTLLRGRSSHVQHGAWEGGLCASGAPSSVCWCC